MILIHILSLYRTMICNGREKPSVIHQLVQRLNLIRLKMIIAYLTLDICTNQQFLHALIPHMTEDAILLHNLSSE